MPDPQRREPLLTDVLFIVAGLGMIGVGYSQQFNQGEYLPGDIRADPAYHVAVFVIFAVIGIVVAVVGSVRLVQGIRDRRR